VHRDFLITLYKPYHLTTLEISYHYHQKHKAVGRAAKLGQGNQLRFPAGEKFQTGSGDRQPFIKQETKVLFRGKAAGM
jgi:hypothetical protein